ncbi:hypothetical protein SEA_NICHOLAS_47 [Mycobacterium phage Nicholas]|uniref:Uncharacterized protein n=1 Tax=Mycobacterium phage Lumos TaxID=1701852 RepID=A0A0K2CMB3_9CAUD|nr:hypothetical protein AVU96_gp047 [Mycobacterium phage Snenia]YP_010012506.1 hypothetical protein J4T93_gp048 [Mycobacterium phage Lumos]ASM62785.1 hypothetical protein SEA_CLAUTASTROPHE_47 [Mycobacterium phage Clautastrophe]ASR86976.1 hypothetical protein SEA_KINGSOLOMON_47 [Mycobacterium phage Kingsolomon]ASR87319.1 hypothetical protein SEA_NICHOLAS_47 [Mycobacterium phage Nicholas]AYB70402.1 hypothetical protein SEA_SAMTY_47 [Mycobacterium phage Samty]QDF16632.1 hypothetical protein PBI_
MARRARAKALTDKYPLLGVLKGADRKRYLAELVEREQEAYDEEKTERFSDMLKRSTYN